MEFDKIASVNNPVFISPKNDVKKSAIKPQTQEEAPKQDVKKAPVDPKYWQNIAFKGKCSANTGAVDNNNTCAIEDDTASYFEEGKKKIYSHLTWKSAELKESYISKLKTLIPKGKAAMQKYVDCCCYSVNVWPDEKGQQFMALAEEMLDLIPETDDNTMRSFCGLMENCVNCKPEYVEEYKDFLKFFLADDTLSPENKIRWYRYAYSVDNLEKTNDENRMSMQAFGDYISCAKDEKELFDLTRVELPTKSMAELSALIKNEKLSTENAIAMIKEADSWDGRKEKDDFLNLISLIYTDSIENNDDTSVEFCRNIYSNKFIHSKPMPKEAYDLISQKDAFKKGVADWFMENAEKSSYTIFSRFSHFNEILDCITPENFDDLKACSDESVKNGNTFRVEFANEYKNPKTGLFDKAIYDATKEYIKKKSAKNDVFSMSWGYERPSSIIKASVDMQTGEISPVAISFVDKHFLGIEDDSKAAKLKKSLLKKIKGGKRSTSYYTNNMYEDYQIADIINMLKDNAGTFNPKNLKCMSKLLEIPNSSFAVDFSFFDKAKDENGVIDDWKFDFLFNAFKNSKNSNFVSKTAQDFDKYSSDELRMAYDTALDFFKDSRQVVPNFSQFLKYCWGDGEEKINNAIFVKDICAVTNGRVALSDSLFELTKKEENKDFIFEFIEKHPILLRTSGINPFIDSASKLLNENGSLDEFAKEQMDRYANKSINFFYFNRLYEACITNKDNPKDGFLQKDFDKVASLLKSGSFGWISVEPKTLIDIMNNEISPIGLQFKEKVSLLNLFMGLKNNADTKDFDSDFVNEMINALDKSIRCDNVYLPISDEVRQTFNTDIIGNKKPKGEDYTEFEKTMIDAVPYFESLQDGLKTTYPMDKFLEDLSSLCDSEEKIKILKAKTGISTIRDDSSNPLKITGYNGIFVLDELDCNDDFQNKLYKLIHKFMYENEVKTGNIKLDDELNKIIKACPEFINTIGKKQHGTHKHTLDIHSLLVLARSISNPDYLKLDSVDKTMLKVAAIFHDIAKAKGTVDTGHQEPSSVYTRSIVKKFFGNEDTRDRIYELIRNHHWLGEYANSSDKEKCAKEIAYKFRRHDDFDIAKIMAKADLMSVSESFYDSRKGALEDKNLEPIQKFLDKFYGSGCAIISDYPLNEVISDKHIQTKDGREYKVINFHEIDDDTDLSEFGFQKGKTKKDVNFLVHMVPEHNMKGGLVTVDMLTSPVNGGVLSESIITPEYKRTYCDRKCGVILSEINANLVNMNNSNQGSGNEKDFNNIIELVFGWNKNRDNFKNGFLNALGFEEGEISDKEYGDFYKKNILSKKSYSEFSSSKEYTLGNRKITGKDVVNAIKAYQDSLIDKNETKHNELVGYIPKIKAVVAKEKTLDDVPNELLDFAYENKLPVVLI